MSRSERPLLSFTIFFGLKEVLGKVQLKTLSDDNKKRRY